MADMSIAEHAERIRSHWYKSTASILEAATACREANEVLSQQEKKKLLTRLPFSDATFSKLVAIGNDRRIKRRNIQELLPPSFSSMYEVTLLNDDQLESAVREKILTPQAKRADITRWRNKANGAHKQPLYASIYLTKDLTTEQFGELKTQLEQLGEQFSLKLSLREFAHEKRMIAWQKRIDKFIHTECRKVLRSFIDYKTSDGALRFGIRGFGEEEIKITAGLSKEEILFVFNSIGLEHDRYDTIERDILEKYPPPSFSYWKDETSNDLVDFQLPVKKKKRNLADYVDFK